MTDTELVKYKELAAAVSMMGTWRNRHESLQLSRK